MKVRKLGRRALILAGSLIATAPLVLVAFYSILYPWLSLIPGGLLAALYSISRKRAILLAAGSWFCYLAYEWGMKLRILCSGECNIRIDLLLIYPILLILSLSAFVVFFRDFGKSPEIDS